MTASNTRKWLVLSSTSLGAFMGSIMFTSVNVAMPSIMTSLETSFNVVQWVVLAYLLATGTLLPIVGRLADMLGKKSLYIWGYFLFTLGSLLSGIAPTIITLILFRALQGIGSALLTALSMAIVTDTFSAQERGKAIGINGSVLSLGVVLGPTLGGFLADISWRWIFLMAVPIGMLGILVAQRYIPRYERQAGQHFDIPGAILLLLTLLSLLLALTFGQGIGFGHPLILLLFTLSLVFCIGFIAFELRVEEPVLDLRLFKNPQLNTGLITGFLVFVAITGAIFLIPFYLENILGFPSRTVGLLMSINPIMLVIMAPLSGIIADRIGERPVTAVALLFMLAGYLALTTLSTTTTALGYLLRFLPVAIGMGIFQTPNNSAIMGSVPKSRSGVAGGLLALTRTLGSTAGIAVIGTIWAVSVLTRAPELSSATTAPATFQVAALHDVLRLTQFLIAASFGVTIWRIIRQRHAKTLRSKSSSND